MILVAYDGSDDAREAIAHVGRLMPGATTTVVSVWEPFVDALRHSTFGMGTLMAGTVVETEIDEAKLAESRESADEGVELAVEAGLVARPRSESRVGSIAETLLVTAAAVDADLVVAGTRGRGGFASFVLGSVSNALVQHADRAILIVPSPALAERRATGTDRG
ncbi:universal stress protein [Patulibacter sp.]|uniref:universal stress protein n=1 Tax=Patulibacter sp. TaxID=1912859 RepID=UPI002725FD09|nr:universal stress protein [Patulibacter sp.]MDO9410890.1 universal stress protein [Patulibacter sp.]